MSNTSIRRFEFEEVKRLQSEVIVKHGALSELDALGVLSGVRKGSTHLLITDKNVEKLYMRPVLESIEQSGRLVRSLVVPANEGSKSFKWYTQLVAGALNYNFDKHSVIFSLGGGVINNLAGFLASTLYRGIGLIHLPTSVLSQVDAAISFKQAINFDHGKNLIGSFHAPSKIVVDPAVLRTLDIRFVRDGLAESVKHALCHDSTFLSFLRSGSAHLLDEEFLTQAVMRSIELKMEVMSGDITPDDTDYNESIKHYGHSIGHAVEHLSDGEIYHGEGISIGMCVSAEVAVLLGRSDEATLDAHYDIFESVGLPTIVPTEFTLADIWDRIRYDKHFLNGEAYMGLIRTIGVMARVDESHFGFYVDQKTIFTAIDRNRRRGKARAKV